ncbi:hypothetical protein VNO78_19458 [Psophocarpus tetragonolobus]|uniref:Glucose-methanol-choline oxidoreductase C-terminal domain-containing protein n=1 Tax=Psophocarpus tetragonolobus TaxID=3891 RepID=A0AAN9SBI2_PSOTE
MKPKNFINSLLDISPSSFFQQFISKDEVFNVRARVLGGGSVMNAGFYSRASSSKVVFEPPMLQWQSTVRDALLEVGVLPYNGFTFDHLHGTKVGATIFYNEGNRHTAADLLEYADPKMISVYIHATVQKILFKYNTEKRRPQAYGVIFKDALGVMHRAYLSAKSKNEIILSAGSWNQSGFGSALGWARDGDNPMNALIVPSPVPVEVSPAQTVGITKFGSFIETDSGLTLDHSWYERLQGIFEFANQSGQPSVFPSEAKESIANTIRSLANPTFNRGVIAEKIMGPQSMGNLELITTNANDNPSVTFNYFQDLEDLRMCVEGMKTIIDVLNSKAFSKFRYNNMPVQDLINLMVYLPMNMRPKHISAAFSLEQYCIDTVLTMWHYRGGCQSRKVVDNNYKFIGVEALRVIDGSTFYGSPGTNPQATVMMLGRSSCGRSWMSHHRWYSSSNAFGDGVWHPSYECCSSPDLIVPSPFVFGIVPPFCLLVLEFPETLLLSRTYVVYYVCGCRCGGVEISILVIPS